VRQPHKASLPDARRAFNAVLVDPEGIRVTDGTLDYHDRGLELLTPLRSGEGGRAG
jgi:hypothetical protein